MSSNQQKRPTQGSDLYVVWFWLRHLEHLRAYASPEGLGDTADLHEDLREIRYEDAMAAFNRLQDERASLEEQLEAAEQKLTDIRAIDVGWYPPLTDAGKLREIKRIAGRAPSPAKRPE